MELKKIKNNVHPLFIMNSINTNEKQGLKEAISIHLYDKSNKDPQNIDKFANDLISLFQLLIAADGKSKLFDHD